MQKGTGPVTAFTMDQTKELQQYLIKAGHDVGGADGRLGTSTRNAVRAMQIKLGLPADSYPTVELLDRLRAGH
jgi:peptidoglycan hydrolase-like protein with peptidoglycan-binding domain